MDFICIEDLAKMLGVRRTRAYELVKQRVIPSVRIGGRIRIPRAAYAAWIDQQSHTALANVENRSHAEHAA